MSARDPGGSPKIYPTFWIAVMGRTGTGKSSFVNTVFCPEVKV
jgi:predicted GTPase